MFYKEKNKIRHLKANLDMRSLAKLADHIVYAQRDHQQSELSLILPWNAGFRDCGYAYPVIVFIQGSGWTTPQIGFQIPQLCEFARDGYIVASVGHRSCLDGNLFPACLQDVKCAIRYLRKEKDTYHIDDRRIAVWGTFSGGNLALLTGLTADDERYKTEDYTDFSDSVHAVISCFGATNMLALEKEMEEIPEIRKRISLLTGDKAENRQEKLREMSPVYQVKKGKQYPPFLLMHGTADRAIPYSQMIQMYETLCRYGVETEAYAVDGAVHEDSFWSEEVYAVIKDFIGRTI